MFEHTYVQVWFLFVAGSRRFTRLTFVRICLKKKAYLKAVLCWLILLNILDVCCIHMYIYIFK